METPPGVEKDGTRNGKAYKHNKSPTSLWSVQGRLLDLDDADRRWASAASGLTDEQQQSESLTLPSDVVFLSKHVAKSGVPALCVHPIGVPNVREAEQLTHAFGTAALLQPLVPLLLLCHSPTVPLCFEAQSWELIDSIDPLLPFPPAVLASVSTPTISGGFRHTTSCPT